MATAACSYAPVPASSYGREPIIAMLSGDPYVIVHVRVISGALVDGSLKCLLRCGHATTARAPTIAQRSTAGTAV